MAMIYDSTFQITQKRKGDREFCDKKYSRCSCHIAMSGMRRAKAICAVRRKVALEKKETGEHMVLINLLVRQLIRSMSVNMAHVRQKAWAQETHRRVN